jgi:hypothetical protein
MKKGEWTGLSEGPLIRVGAKHGSLRRLGRSCPFAKRLHLSG